MTAKGPNILIEDNILSSCLRPKVCNSLAVTLPPKILFLHDLISFSTLFSQTRRVRGSIQKLPFTTIFHLSTSLSCVAIVGRVGRRGRRTSTGSELFLFLGSGVSQFLGKSIIVNLLCKSKDSYQYKFGSVRRYSCGAEGREYLPHLNRIFLSNGKQLHRRLVSTLL